MAPRPLLAFLVAASVCGGARGQAPAPIDILLLDQAGAPLPDLSVETVGTGMSAVKTDARGIGHVDPSGPGFGLLRIDDPAFDLVPARVYSAGAQIWGEPAPVASGRIEVRQGALELGFDAGKPIEIRAWRRGPAVDLIHFWRRDDYPLPGGRGCVDLRRTPARAWTPGPAGDLCIGMSRDAGGDYLISFDAAGGGLRRMGNLVPQRAPADGYVERASARYAPGGGSAVTRESWWFIRARNGGLRGRLHISLWLAEVASVKLEGWLNPRGDDNLQYDDFHRLEPDFDHPYDEPGGEAAP